MIKTAIALAVFATLTLSQSANAQPRFDESGDSWIQKTDKALQGENKTRAQIVGDLDKFLCHNYWDVGLSKWVPITGEPRVMSKLSRQQQNLEISMFAKTHTYDVFAGTWIDNATGKRMVMPK
jgi:hypothetical protein